MHDKLKIAPESSAVRVALWRALHALVDGSPKVIDDEIGLQLIDPDDDWRERPDMHAEGTKYFRASIVARARFIEDMVIAQSDKGVVQYVLLGAGLDTFAQRRDEIARHMQVYEVDQAGPQMWKSHRLIELGYGIPEWLHLVQVDFETQGDWWRKLLAAGFDTTQPAVLTSTGVSMYLTRDAVKAMLKQAAALAPGSTFAMTFLLPIEMAAPEIREGMERSQKGAQASGTPFISFFTPDEIVALALDAGFKRVEHVSADALNERYFKGRSDGLYLPSNSEEFIIATT